jgi:hypothetical protein
MIAAIAHMRGYDVRTDRVRAFPIACLLGSGVTDVLKETGLSISTKLTAQAVGRVSGAMLTRINQLVGFRLVTKAGATSVVNLGRIVPFVGGLIGGAFDAITTKVIATAAKQVFPRLAVAAAPAPSRK